MHACISMPNMRPKMNSYLRSIYANARRLGVVRLNGCTHVFEQCGDDYYAIASSTADSRAFSGVGELFSTPTCAPRASCRRIAHMYSDISCILRPFRIRSGYETVGCSCSCPSRPPDVALRRTHETHAPETLQSARRLWRQMQLRYARARALHSHCFRDSAAFPALLFNSYRYDRRGGVGMGMDMLVCGAVCAVLYLRDRVKV